MAHTFKSLLYCNALVYYYPRVGVYHFLLKNHIRICRYVPLYFGKGRLLKTTINTRRDVQLNPDQHLHQTPDDVMRNVTFIPKSLWNWLQSLPGDKLLHGAKIMNIQIPFHIYDNGFASTTRTSDNSQSHKNLIVFFLKKNMGIYHRFLFREYSEREPV